MYPNRITSYFYDYIIFIFIISININIHIHIYWTNSISFSCNFIPNFKTLLLSLIYTMLGPSKQGNGIYTCLIRFRFRFFHVFSWRFLYVFTSITNYVFKSFPENHIKTYFTRFWNVFKAKIKHLLKPVSNLWLLRPRLAFVDIDLKKKKHWPTGEHVSWLYVLVYTCIYVSKNDIWIKCHLKCKHSEKREIIKHQSDLTNLNIILKTHYNLKCESYISC